MKRLRQTGSNATRSPDPGTAESWFERRRYWAAALLGLLVLAVFSQTLRHDFICYDDNGYVTENAWVQSGLSRETIAHAFRTTELAYWHPLTWLSHLADVELFGLKPWGHHLTSLLWHAVNSVLVFLGLRALTGSAGRSWVVAALFGLHPLHVESVAWVAERKDVLSTFFWLLALGSYAQAVVRWRQARSGGWIFYGLSLLAFLAGLMSKPMVVTLPCVLLLLDWWPLRRTHLSLDPVGPVGVARLVAEKLPFFALSAWISLRAIDAQAALGTLQTTAAFPLGARIANALGAYGDYLGKCFWPANLAIFYPYPEQPALAKTILASAVLVALSAVAWRWRGSRSHMLVGWLFFLGTLVPAIGLVQVGGQAMADRYSYVPLLGIFGAVVWLAADFAAQRRLPAQLLAPGTAVVLVGLALTTLRQLRHWRDSETLFTHTLKVTTDNWLAHFCLGYHFAKDPVRLDESIAHYRAVVRLKPDFAEGHFSLGAMLARRPGGAAEAIVSYQTALRFVPDNVKFLRALAPLLEADPARLTDAIATYEAIVRHEPNDAEARNRLGNLLAQVPGRLGDAALQYEAVRRLRPDWIEVNSNLGIIYAQLPGRLPEAIAAYEAVLSARPDFAEAHNNLANALSTLPGREMDAAAAYENALRIRPRYFEAHFNYANLLSRLPGKKADAIAHYEAALRINPQLGIARGLINQLRAR